VFAPKIDGTLVLERIIQGIPLDFLVLFSSTASVVGGFGLVDYSAANAFLDAFAHDHTARRNIFTVAIDWSAWQWDDWQAGLMAAIAPVQLRFKKLRELLGITFQEGMDAFERIVSNSAAQLIVSTQDFGIVLAEHTGSATLDLLKGLDTHLDAPAHPRPDLDNQFVAPRSEIEQTMTVIWQELLGIAQAGVHDNFLDLGGHSLLAVQLVSRIREAFQLDLPMRALFEAPTIAELSSVIAASRLKQADRDEDRDEDDDLAQLLAEIERLSPEELDRKLAEERGD
jgi:acyl carrier protein